ncbi:hypothetical protein HELRODRAFT_182255 [Helobdella robusta]|uniref:THAP-type domain-containing protein n=1 Tax=Helobdella robusta TaxID=6412 RepID=T1FI01_HELRO|nr:hypothetical protein HELRODRAFT_182255 [Helobdella robusta]ESN91099.1 hypothetical protein HELRODRAFT_182255 [Helobdella robusta]
MQNDWNKCIRKEINDFKWLPSKNARICSDHFCNKDYKGYDGERKVMLKKAFPCFQQYSEISKYTIVTFDLGDKKSSSNFPPKVFIEALYKSQYCRGLAQVTKFRLWV